MRRLTARAQFLRAARGRKIVRRGFVLQAVRLPAAEGAEIEPGLGFTASKRVGNAPQRNRVKRRLRAAAAANAPHFPKGFEFVLIGRRETLNEPFERLVDGLAGALTEITAPRANRKSGKPTGRS